MHVGNTGASALAAALGRGALPRLMILWLSEATIGDAGLVAPRAGLAAAARAGATQPLLQPARRRGPRRPRGATAAAGRCAAAAGWRADEAQTSSSTSTSPRSPTPAAPPSPPRSTATLCQRSRTSICLASLLSATHRKLPSTRHWSAQPLDGRHLSSTLTDTCTCGHAVAVA